MNTLHEAEYTHTIISCLLIRMRDFSGKNCRENHNTVYVQYFFLFALFMRYAEKYCRAGWATDDSVAHVYCMLDT